MTPQKAAAAISQLIHDGHWLKAARFDEGIFDRHCEDRDFIRDYLAEFDRLQG